MCACSTLLLGFLQAGHPVCGTAFISYTSSPQPYLTLLACRNKALEAPEGKDEGWDLSWMLTTPLVPKDERDAPIELGELLGAGSFGERQQSVGTPAAAVPHG